GSYLLTVGTYGDLYGFFTADDLRKGLNEDLIESLFGLGPEDLSGALIGAPFGLKGGLIEFSCGLGPEDLSGGLI
nr:hypothetical protein [Tanacetum cinerariifolium]